MPILRFNSAPHIDYPTDVQRIVDVCLARGFEIAPTDAQAAWDHISETYAAGWLVLPEDDEDLYRSVSQVCGIYNY